MTYRPAPLCNQWQRKSANRNLFIKLPFCICLRTTELPSLTISLVVAAGPALPSPSITLETLSRGRATHTHTLPNQTQVRGLAWTFDIFLFDLLQHASQQAKATMHSQSCTSEPLLQYPFRYVSPLEAPNGRGVEKRREERRRRSLSRLTPALSVCVCVSVSACVLAPHIEDLVLLPSPVLRLLNLIDDTHLHNDEEYEGKTLKRSSGV